jgi:transcriptional repressor NrdR
MRCPKCNFPNTKVYDTRVSHHGKVTRRRRECYKCSYRFTTIEEIKVMDLKVEKRNGQVTDFSEEKLEQGIRKAFNKRTIDNQKIATVVQRVVDDVLATGKKTVKATKIGKLVLKHLKEVDEAAYICYGAMFWSFSSVKDFNRLLGELDHEG